MKKKLAIIGLIAMLCTSFAGCKSNNSADKTTSNETKNITVGLNLYQTNLDPALEWNGWYVSMYGIGETLVKFNKNMEIEPSLADTWKKVDDLTWQFHIRDGVKFHNGNPLTANAVKASMERALKANPRTQEMLVVNSIVADGQNLTITTKTPHTTLLGNLADPINSIIDASAAADTVAKAPIGTGPFKIKSYTDGSQVVVERYNDYWGGKALINEATFKYIKDDNTRSMALQSGEIDVANNVSINNLSLFEDKSKYTISTTTSLRIVMSYFNFNNEFLKDPAVRKAIALGVDRESYSKSLLKGTAVAAVGPFPGSLPFGNKNLMGYTYNKAEATKTLNDAGYKDTDGDGILEKNGKKLALNIAVFPTRAEIPVIGEAMQAQLKEIGIAANLKSYETVNPILKSGDFDLSLYNVNTATTGDPQSFLELYYRTGGSTNFGKYSNPTVDALIDKFKTEYDIEKRNEIATKVQQTLLEDNAGLFLVNPMSNRVSKSTVTGMEVYPIDFYMLDNKVDKK
ncbi:ABC transporter substrate-binding protein [Clostridium magnum]|uniref:Oligopeptide-binding protein AppA n=1 Tax=Clostridium magnum DSM 2767 TaxID=1121326 RepID=A0A161YME5_9CLOT|nr:ABC transporter substrate-binding protein [Clostridium magnum]KZL91812.1 oligopeptide-binding protein AppA precursor [Clostridium magnum DSM 2767]SHI25818.1 peptide/nickel transport system substrate-binding protein [Clostridium magnum DSM 2767]